jgi:multidrug efflux system membrane fusion protein
LLTVSCASLFAGCSGTEARPDDRADVRGTSGSADGNGRGRGGGPAGGGAAVPVVTAKAEVKAMPVTIDAVGTVEAISTVEIRAQVTGQLQQILFTPGQDIRKGQPLFALDPRPLEASLRQAEAVVARDTAQSRDAAAERARAQDLFDRGILPRAEYETRSANAAALEATLAADQAQVDQAKLNLQYAHINSPIDGRTGALKVHVGDLVRANDTEPLVTINQLAPIYVSFSVPARYLIDIRRFAEKSPLPVTVTGQGSNSAAAMPRSGNPPAAASPATGPTATGANRTGASEPHGSGRVTFIDNAVDPTTATINLKATFANTERELWPGLFVQVSLQLTSQPDAVVVPAVAVQTSQQGQYVYVVKPDNTVELRTVTLDRQQGDETIVASGLNGGEVVVTEGQLRLTPGAHVTPSASGPGQTTRQPETTS